MLLELRRAERPGPAPRRATGLFHTAFRYPTREQLGATLRGLVRQRAPLTGASDHLVSEALYLDDPDGLGIELYRDRPREEWPAPQPGAQGGDGHAPARSRERPRRARARRATRPRAWTSGTCT